MLQTRTLLTRLLLIPFSLIIIIGITNITNSHGWATLLYAIIFIGGLLVLLVSISSLTLYENSPYLEKWIGLLLIVMIISEITLKEKWIILITWINLNGELLLLTFFILAVALLLISWQNGLNKRINRFI